MIPSTNSLLAAPSFDTLGISPPPDVASFPERAGPIISRRRRRARRSPRDVSRIDRVRDVGLVVLDVEAAGDEQLACAASEVDVHDRVVAAVRDEDAQVRTAREVGLPPGNRRNEAGEREDPGRRRPVGSQAERVAHDRPHREPAENGPFRRRTGSLPLLLVERGQLPVGSVEGLRIGVADAGHDVPVMARPAGQRQRCARRDDVEPLLRVEDVCEREEISFVGAPSVMEHQQTFGLGRRRPFAVDEAHAPGHSLRCPGEGRAARVVRGERARPALAADARSVRDPRLGGDAPADAGAPRRAAVSRLARALADRRMRSRRPRAPR